MAEGANVKTPVQAQFHVNPASGSDTASGTSPDTAFRSLERARDATRSVKSPWKGNVEILLHGDRYFLKTPLELGPADNGRDGYRLRILAAPGASPILDGGVRIEGWKPFDKDKNIWSAPAPKDLETRQLFVNGRRATRARTISSFEGIEKVEGGYSVPLETGITSWKNPSDVELVYRAIWTSPRVGVESIQEEDGKAVLIMKQPGFINASNKGITSIGTPWFFENAFELLDEPGEWYYDRTGAIGGKPALYYIPFDWEDVTKLEFVAPVLESLITLRGESIESPVQGIDISGIGFQYTTWMRPSGNESVSDAQNNVMRENFGDDLIKRETTYEFVPEAAAILGKYARDVAIDDCSFTHLGGLGIFLGSGAQDIRIVGNTFYDISGTGIQLGDYANWRFPDSEDYIRPTDERLLITRNHIENNYLERCGVEYRSSVGIAISIPRDSVISHNEVINMPYSGMHFGWGWIVLDTSAMGNNQIDNNYVRNTMVELVDGGAIYFLGPTDPKIPPTMLRGNYSLRTRWGQGFYFDEGSSRYTAENNRFERIGDSNIKINGKSSFDIKVTGLYSDKTRNIIPKDIDLGEHRLSIEDHRPVGQEPHTTVAREIRENAGLQKEFADIRPVRTDVVIYELEEGETMGSAFTTTGMDVKPFVTGYSGMAYVDAIAASPESGVSLDVNVSKGGTYELRLRYAAEADTDGLIWQVGENSVEVPFLPATGDRNTWNVVSVPFELKEGHNQLQLKAEKKAPGFLLGDRVDIVPASAVKNP